MKRVVPLRKTTNFSQWRDKNCKNCTKYENTSTSYENANCPSAFDIDIGTITGNIRAYTAEKVGNSYMDETFVTLANKCKMIKK